MAFGMSDEQTQEIAGRGQPGGLQALNPQLPTQDIQRLFLMLQQLARPAQAGLVTGAASRGRTIQSGVEAALGARGLGSTGAAAAARGLARGAAAGQVQQAQFDFNNMLIQLATQGTLGFLGGILQQRIQSAGQIQAAREANKSPLERLPGVGDLFR